MRFWDRRVRALMGCAVAAMLTGCGEPAQLGIAASQARAGSWMTPNAQSANLVYMVQGSKVLIFSFAGKQVGQLTGFGGPEPICSDSQGNVWVGYEASLLEYSHGGTIPIAQLYLQKYYLPTGCAVDPTTGDIAIEEFSYQELPRNVAVYQNIYEPPQTYADPDLYVYGYLGYDDQGNLFVNGTKGHRKLIALFDELPKGGSSFERLSFDVKFREIGGVQWDGQYLALGDDGSQVVYQMNVSNAHGTTQSTTHFHNWKDKAVVPFATQGGILVFALNGRKTGFYNFPQGGKPVHLISLSNTAGLTISVPPSESRRRAK